MSFTYFSDYRDGYRMDYHNPHVELEPLEREIAIVDGALESLVSEGVLPHTRYDHEKMLALRHAVAERFDIPWTAISPRVQRLIYAVNAIARPQVMVAAGVFCGCTFIYNAGAAVGPGACYEARKLVGVEIVPEEAARAERNVRLLDPTGVATIVCDDAVHFLREFDDRIDLLYLDAEAEGERGKSIYLDILEAGYEGMPRGSLVVAHNSVNHADELADYLEFVRDPDKFRNSVNVVMDHQGLEVSLK